MNEKAQQLRERAKRFSIRVLRFLKTLPSDRQLDHVAGQLTRSATSMAANYRAACRGRARSEFIAKLGLVVEEADETEYWLAVIDGAQLAGGQSELDAIQQEAVELRAIFKASLDTARANSQRAQNPAVPKSSNRKIPKSSNPADPKIKYVPKS